MDAKDFADAFNSAVRCGCGHTLAEHGIDEGPCLVCRCDEYTEPSHPYWHCEECGYEDKLKPMPNVSPAVWYGRKQPLKCPKCKSEAFQPTGW
jgi:hypothetical protein